MGRSSSPRARPWRHRALHAAWAPVLATSRAGADAVDGKLEAGAIQDYLDHDFEGARGAYARSRFAGGPQDAWLGEATRLDRFGDNGLIAVVIGRPEGDALRLIDRPQPDWPLARLNRLLYHDLHNRAALAEMADLTELSDNWRDLARRRLITGKTESWTRRLYGQDAPDQ